MDCLDKVRSLSRLLPVSCCQCPVYKSPTSFPVRKKISMRVNESVMTESVWHADSVHQLLYAHRLYGVLGSSIFIRP